MPPYPQIVYLKSYNASFFNAYLTEYGHKVLVIIHKTSYDNLMIITEMGVP